MQPCKGTGPLLAQSILDALRKLSFLVVYFDERAMLPAIMIILRALLIEPTTSLWDAWPIRHTLMVACNTTGNAWDTFIKRPGQTSTYYLYGPWHCHVSAPHWGHRMD